LKDRYAEGWDLATSIKTAVETLGAPDGRTIEAVAIEAGVLDRTRPQRRKFRRLDDDEITSILAG
jgi:proteasome alpha subunit